MYHSVVLLALVYGSKRFLTVDVGQYERVSDGNVFANVAIGKRLAEANIGLPPDENLGEVANFKYEVCLLMTRTPAPTVKKNGRIN
ncbi:hypothetical protein ILUMI_07942 [Ignelater luminosus]|uniref:Uncharacterized protein n=1 Tax=Ignelater luminosus TaxID=2038154 RepID=A0A8K0D7U0_IGNLU|nr:hypothetical protein ILUMI_07942 [Ignelater luminosus]